MSIEEQLLEAITNNTKATYLLRRDLQALMETIERQMNQYGDY